MIEMANEKGRRLLVRLLRRYVLYNGHSKVADEAAEIINQPTAKPAPKKNTVPSAPSFNTRIFGK